MGDPKKQSAGASNKLSKKETEKKKNVKAKDKSEDEEEDEEEEEVHCICDDRDYTKLMICCDYCSVWYHVKCMKIPKNEVDRIEKYACKICEKKNPKAKIEYKKTKKGDKEETPKEGKKKPKENETDEAVRKKSIAKKEKNQISEKKAKTVEKSTKPSTSSICSVKEVKEEPKEEKKTNIQQINQDKGKGIKAKQLDVKIEPSSELPSAPIEHKQPILNALSVQQQHQLDIQEANPGLRCDKCIGCFREENCGKCFTCLQNNGKCCLTRVCVQVEELLKQREKIRISESIADEEMRLMDLDGESSDRQQKSKKGRKPKHLTVKIEESTKQEGKRRRIKGAQHSSEDMHAQLRKAYSNWLKSQGTGSNNVAVRQSETVQCQGPECTNSARTGSKYCSEACGMAIAEQRLQLILPQRINTFFVEQPFAQESDNQRLQQLEDQIGTMNNKLDELGQWKENVHQFVVALKNAHPSGQGTTTEEEYLIVACPVCQGEIAMRECGKHIQSCFVRSERQTTYGTDYQMPINHFNLYCEAYNKINRTFCKRLRYACSEHYKDDEHKVCGCPLKWYRGTSLQFHELFLSSDAIMADEGYCQEKQKSCQDHKSWAQTAFSLIDNERMNLLNKMDELREQHALLRKTLIERGNILSMICNSSSSNQQPT